MLTVERAYEQGRNTQDQALRKRGSTMNAHGSAHRLIASNASGASQMSGFNQQRIVKGGPNKMRIQDDGTSNAGKSRK